MYTAMGNRAVNVLVVDNDQSVRHLVRRQLDHLFDATAIEAADGLAALERLAREPVDLVILDVDMPFMDGVETAEAIRSSAAHAELPIVMMTSMTDEQKVSRLMELKVAEFIVKPFTIDMMRSRLGPLVAKAYGPSKSTDPRGLSWHIASNSRLLVVDDSAEFRRTFADLFKTVCRVDGSESATAALRQCLANAPDAVFLGDVDCPLFNEAALLNKLRTAPDLKGVRRFRISPDDQIEAAQAGGLYDGVMSRTLEYESLLACLAPHVDTTSLARLLMAPTSPCVEATSVALTNLLTQMLGGRIDRQPASAAVMPADNRWVNAVVELRDQHQRWRLSLTWTYAFAMAASAASLGMTTDKISDTQIADVVSEVAGRAAERLQGLLFDRGLGCRMGPPAARFVSARHADVDGLAKAHGTSWHSTNHGAAGVLLRIAPG